MVASGSTWSQTKNFPPFALALTSTNNWYSRSIRTTKTRSLSRVMVMMKVLLVKTKISPTSRLKNCTEVLESVWNIELFFLRRGKFTVVNKFSLLADKVSENAVNERSYQSTQERYFITK